MKLGRLTTRANDAVTIAEIMLVIVACMRLLSNPSWIRKFASGEISICRYLKERVRDS
jgi:hypothetical protein